MPHITASLSQSIHTVSYHKPYLRQWLIQQIDSDQYPGLCWLDANHTKFRIPWKHNSRRDISENDYKLFKAWAMVSGKYTGLQAEHDPAKWKTNFRCALNSNSWFKRIEDSSMNPSDPHKVYEILSSPSSSQNTSPNGTSPVEDGPLPGICNISAYPVVPPTLLAGIYDIGRLSLEDVIDGEGIAFGRQPLQNNFPGEGMPCYDWTHRTYADDHLTHCCSPEVPPYGVPDHGRSPVQNACSPTMSSSQMAYEQPDQIMTGYRAELPDGRPWEATANRPASTVLEAATALPVRPEPSIQLVNFEPIYNVIRQRCYIDVQLFDLEITINYRKTQMLCLEVKGSNIYQLCYNGDACYGQQIHFPSPQALPDGKQVSATEQILDNIKNGLLIKIAETGIFASRLGKSKVFCVLEHLSEEAGENNNTSLLPRDKECMIFSFEKFLYDWKNFKENSAGSPKFEIYLCFGQEMHDLQYKEKKLILVKIVPKFCRYLYEIAQREGASSLNDETLNLQISNSNSSLFDFIESYLNGEESARMQ